MKPPTWAYVIGILMLLFGGCGIMQDYQNIRAPEFLEMGEGIFDEIEKEIEDDLREEREEREQKEKAESEISETESVESEEESTSETVIIEETENEQTVEEDEVDDEQRADEKDMKELEMVKDILNVSDYYKKWVVIFGYIGIVISALFIVAGLFLMIPKSFSIPLAYGVLGLSIVVGIVQYIIFSRDDSSGMVTMFSGLSVIFSIIIDFVLLAVIVASDKDAFLPLEEEMS